jgi:hypothetical protein
MVESNLARLTVDVHAEVTGSPDRWREEAVASVDEVSVNQKPLISRLS